MIFTFDQLLEILGQENESALEHLFTMMDWEDDVTIEEFLPEWTSYIEHCADIRNMIKASRL